MNRFQAYVAVEQRLDRIAHGNARPGHVANVNKASMARMAAEALDAMEVLFPGGVVDGVTVDAGR